MAEFKIEGGSPLYGNVEVSGAKNEALKLIPFSILLNKPVLLENVPNIVDVERQFKILKSLGGDSNEDSRGFVIDPTGVDKFDILSNEASKLRASLVFMGPLLAKFGKATILQPGGCKIGSRPIETHLDAFKQLGAKISETPKLINIEINKIKDTTVTLKEQSVTATENVCIYASGVECETIIKNCAIEPEVIALLKEIKKAGADVTGIGTRDIKIKGSSNLELDVIRVIPDRIEAATFAILFIVTGSVGTISPFPKDELRSFVELIEKSGAKLAFKGDSCEIKKNDHLQSFNIKTAPYPGFPTDLQSPMSLLASKAVGTSYINEEMYENRLGYLNELKKMGLDVEIISKKEAKITGPVDLKPTTIHSLDLRSGITLLMAGLMTKGITIIKEAEIIDRGYENIELKLSRLGAKIQRIS